MKLKRTMISVCRVYLLARWLQPLNALQKRVRPTSPVSEVDKAMKEKSESAKSLGRAAPPPRQTSPDTIGAQSDKAEIRLGASQVALFAAAVALAARSASPSVKMYCTRAVAGQHPFHDIARFAGICCRAGCTD